ncbi:WD REPEATS REGION domain-containing protein [Citrus sinensis]|uniref:WD REPEATS REGION domain-containing protein n=1 Tax=Citrus sinensis TaxID=2711 RepID=A0ACB8KC07_CITSI|nr:WD REPEATS REGION domain-containing protein [Citrus sinensis]
MPSEGGYLEAEGVEKTWRIKQEAIAREVDILSSRNQYDIMLPELGPYTLDFTSSGRYMAAAGCKGHLAVVDMNNMNLVKEIQISQYYFAYSNGVIFFVCTSRFYLGRLNGYTDCLLVCSGTLIFTTEMALNFIVQRRVRFTCRISIFLAEHGEVLKLQFLLASINKLGQLRYQNVTMGEIVGNFWTGLGRTDVIRVNPFNGVVSLGHSGGTVTMWKPTTAALLIKMLCHQGPVSALAFHPNGHLMATSGKDCKIKIWDLRKYEVLQTLPGHAKTLDFSRKGYQIGKVSFRPYEDVLGIGHSMGVSGILIPGSGEPNFDSWVANPFETSKQRREKEVHSLLDKLPPETIMLNPSKIGTVREAKKKEKPTKQEREDEMEAAVEAVKGFVWKNKTKGRNKPSKKAKKKQELVAKAKRPFLDQQLKEEQSLSKKKQKLSEEVELPASLRRFACKKPTA